MCVHILLDLKLKAALPFLCGNGGREFMKLDSNVPKLFPIWIFLRTYKLHLYYTTHISVCVCVSACVRACVHASLFVLLFVCAKAILLRNAYTSGSLFDSLPLVCALVRLLTHSIHIHSKRQRARREERGRENEKWIVWLSSHRRCRRFSAIMQWLYIVRFAIKAFSNGR